MTEDLDDIAKNPYRATVALLLTIGLILLIVCGFVCAPLWFMLGAG